MQRKLKVVLGPLILLLTLAAFAHYLQQHPELLTQLRDTPPGTAVALIGVYVVWFGALILLLYGSLRMYRKQMGIQENFLLCAYSSLVNFFGPGQSGPAVRGAYLYKRHGVRIRDYMFTTFLYYAAYAVISALFLFGGSRPWWQTIGISLGVAGASYLVVRRVAQKGHISQDKPSLTAANFGIIILATFMQCALQVVIYFIELHSIDPGISVIQVITYTGAANFALFVALTPGAIGIRESFLLFTQHLHGIDSHTIVAANVIDRGAYLTLLGILFVFVVSLHAKRKLRLNRPKDL